MDYINNNFDVNHVVTSHAPDVINPPAITPIPAPSPDSNPQTLQQSNPYIQNDNTSSPPH